MSTVNRHSLKKSHQPHRKQSSQSPSHAPRRAVRRLWRSRGVWIIAVVLVVLIGLGSWYYGFRGATVSPTVGAIHNSAQTASMVTPVATATPTWRTVLTLNGPTTGNVTKKTQTFTTANNWQITWACQGVNGVDDWLYIAIYYPNGRLYNSGAQITCIAARQVVGNAQEAKGGTFYLTVDANTAWTITIQNAK